MPCTYVNVDKGVLYVSAHEQYVDLLRHRRTERCTDCIQSQPMFWSSINMAARAACKSARSPSSAPLPTKLALSHSAKTRNLQYRVGSVYDRAIRQGEALFLTGFTILL